MGRNQQKGLQQKKLGLRRNLDEEHFHVNLVHDHYTLNELYSMSLTVHSERIKEEHPIKKEGFQHREQLMFMKFAINSSTTKVAAIHVDW